MKIVKSIKNRSTGEIYEIKPDPVGYYYSDISKSISPELGDLIDSFGQEVFDFLKNGFSIELTRNTDDNGLVNIKTSVNDINAKLNFYYYTDDNRVIIEDVSLSDLLTYCIYSVYGDSEFTDFIGFTSSNCPGLLYTSDPIQPGRVYLNIYSGMSINEDIIPEGANSRTVYLKFNSLANGEHSRSDGANTLASGSCSHSEGANTFAMGGSSHSEGATTIAIGDCSHAEGAATFSIGGGSHAEGQYSVSVGTSSHAEGNSTNASGTNSHAEGSSTSATGEQSHSEGVSTTANGEGSHAEGYDTTASGDYSHAEGYSTTASGERSHAEGQGTTASGSISHAEGQDSTSEGISSHAEGYDTTASGDYSHAEGYITTASSAGSHTEGYSTTASGDYSHAEGWSTTTTNEAEHAEGKYNLSNHSVAGIKNLNTISSIGIGTGESDRKNAFEVMESGDVYIYNVGGYNGTNIEDSQTLQSVINNPLGYDINKKSFVEGNSLGSLEGLYYDDIEHILDVSEDESHLRPQKLRMSYINFNNSLLQPYIDVKFSTPPQNPNLFKSIMFIDRENYIFCFRNIISIETPDSGTDYYRFMIDDIISDSDQATTTDVFVGISNLVYNRSNAIAEHTHNEGLYTITTNAAEHAEGSYNMSHENTISSIGIGSDKDNRKNALEVINTGDVYIQNIGNYNGASLSGAKSLQTIISELQSTITTLTSRIAAIES